MNNIYFKKVIARGFGKKESSIEFIKGLNIICGPSNTGKTLIFKIFKQVFGADNQKNMNNDDESFIIENDTGYTEFSLIISKNNDDVILTRKIDSDFISVESHSPYVESGDYSFTKKSGYKLINYALLQIFNFDSFKLPTKKDGTSTSFSLKFLDYLFLADEGRVDEGSQILVFNSKKYSSITQSMANLLYLTYDMDFSKFLKNEDLEKIKIRRGAVKKFISDKIESNNIEINKLRNKLRDCSLMEDDSNKLQIELNKIRENINVKYKEIANLENTIITISEKINSDRLLIERLENLSTQYKSDLERLNFIVSGKDEFDTNKEEHECPYCHSKIHEDKTQINIEDVEFEVNYAISNLNDVSDTLVELLNEHESDKNYLKSFKKQAFELNKVINNLINERGELELSLRQFDELIKCRNRIKFLNDDNELLSIELSKMSNQLKVEREDFVPKEHFKPSFFQTMTENIREIMHYCGDMRYTSTMFDQVSFDISIRGQCKSANNGKGYRSFVNSVTLLSFRKLLNEKGRHQLPVYVIDSPLKNLDVGDLNKDNIKDRFFKYLMEITNNEQIIIIENINNFSMTEELKEKANVIEFTHDENIGRYGFLLDYRD